jgi:hypothetical protein
MPSSDKALCKIAVIQHYIFEGKGKSGPIMSGVMTLQVLFTRYLYICTYTSANNSAMISRHT